MSEHRCLSSAEVVPGTMKRCIRDLGHAEAHIWVEGRNAVGEAPLFVEWDDQKRTQTYRLTSQMKEPNG